MKSGWRGRSWVRNKKDICKIDRMYDMYFKLGFFLIFVYLKDGCVMMCFLFIGNVKNN